MHVFLKITYHRLLYFVAGTRKQVEEEENRVLAEDSDDSIDNEVLNLCQISCFIFTQDEDDIKEDEKSQGEDNIEEDKKSTVV